MMTDILNVREITKRFGGLVALNKVTMDVHEGEILGLMGPNGSGKTTLVNVISGIYKADSGQVIYMGRDVTNLPPHKRVELGIARTFQTPRPFNSLTVLENVMMPILHFGHEPDVRGTAYKLLEFVGLEKYAESPIGKLNLAMRKKLDLARALGTKPKILMIDEIAAGLSEGEVNDMANLLMSIRDSGVTLLVIEHVIFFLRKLCDRVVVLDEGVKIAEGDVEEVIRMQEVISAYIGEVIE